MQTIITVNSDVQLSPVIYRDTANWKRKFVGNSNDNNFLLGCPIELGNISRRSKLRLETLSKLKWQ